MGCSLFLRAPRPAPSPKLETMKNDCKAMSWEIPTQTQGHAPTEVPCAGYGGGGKVDQRAELPSEQLPTVLIGHCPKSERDVGFGRRPFCLSRLRPKELVVSTNCSSMN